jgi:hypothetical protein
MIGFNPLVYIGKKYVTFKSWKTPKRILVIESDDWGSERTKDKETLAKLNQINSKVPKDLMTNLDSIASVDDLELLFDILSSKKDNRNHPAKITINVCTANPDFEKIKESGYHKFHYKPFYKSIGERYRGAEIMNLWSEGISKKLLSPQLHGREHVHALAWLGELRASNSELLKAFELGAWGIPYNAVLYTRRQNLQAALDLYSIEGEAAFQDQWIKDSVSIFKSHFGFTPKTFIPPAYTWHSQIYNTVFESGIKAIQGIGFQYQPAENSEKKYDKKLHITGSMLGKGVYRISRNSFYEQWSAPQRDWVSTCLKSIEFAFSNRMPAILGAHRVNFIGSLNPKNRDTNLRNLNIILDIVLKKWPDVEFWSSDELIDQIELSFNK